MRNCRNSQLPLCAQFALLRFVVADGKFARKVNAQGSHVFVIGHMERPLLNEQRNQRQTNKAANIIRSGEQNGRVGTSYFHHFNAYTLSCIWI